MEFGTILHSVPDELRTLFRSLEKSLKKEINIKWSILFNNTCLLEGLLPNYTKIRNQDPAESHTNNMIEYRR